MLKASSALDQPGVFGLSPEAVTLGRPDSSGGGTIGRVTAIQTEGAVEIAKHVLIGTDQGRHILGTTTNQADTSTFSGNVTVGLGALNNGDNPHLEIEVASNAWVNFTGNITNALGIPSVNYALRNGKVLMLGPGVARLTGDNAYLGGTIVSNGTLLASSAKALGLGGVTVAGGTLGGSYTVTGAVAVLAGAALTAGETNSAGTATLQGGLSLAANSALKFQVAGAAADRLLISGGTFAVTAPIQVAIETLAPATASEYTLLDWSGAAGSPQLSDFVLGNGSDAYQLVLRNSTLVARALTSQGTIISLR